MRIFTRTGGPLKAYADGWQLETGLQAYRSGSPVQVLQLPSIPSGGKLSNARTGIQGKKKYYKQSGKQNQLITSLFNRTVQFQGRSINLLHCLILAIYTGLIAVITNLQLYQLYRITYFYWDVRITISKPYQFYPIVFESYTVIITKL